MGTRLAQHPDWVGGMSEVHDRKLVELAHQMFDLARSGDGVRRGPGQVVTNPRVRGRRTPVE
jgi:hypothetical protein